MPVATAGNSFLVGIDKQTNEATVSSTADYSVAAFEVTPHIEQPDHEVEVLDGSSIEGDKIKGPSSWTYDLATPAYGDSLGRFLQAMWPTDTTTGAGPYTHTFSGLGGTQPWIAMYSEWTLASEEHTFGKGLCTRIGFEAPNNGDPLTLRFTAAGQEASGVDFTASVADNMADGYFRLVETGGKIELDLDTPDVNPSSQPEKIESFSLEVTRDVTAKPVVDSFTVSTMGQGKVRTTGSASFLFSSWSAFNTTYFGSAAGTTVSPTKVYGALELTCKHSVQSTWEFRIYIPKVEFKVGDVTPNASGDAMVMPVTFNLATPASGDRIQPVLINSTSAAY